MAIDAPRCTKIPRMQVFLAPIGTNFSEPQEGTALGPAVSRLEKPPSARDQSALQVILGATRGRFQQTTVAGKSGPGAIVPES